MATAVVTASGPDQERASIRRARRRRMATRLMTWGTLSALPSPAAAGVIAGLIGLSWLVTILLGGAGLVAPHWFYLPVFLAGLRFGPWGALASAATSMVVAGPLLPLSFNPTTPQTTSDWVRQGIFFIVIGQLVTLSFSAVRGLSGQEAHLVEEQAVREAQAEGVREGEQRFRALVQRATDMILVVNPDGAFLSESPAVERILGWEPDQRLGLFSVDFVHPDDRERAEMALDDVRSPGRSCTVELRKRDAGGAWHWVESTITNMVDEPTVRGIVINDRVIDECKALEEELLHRALHDSLTGLANRSVLRERLEGLLARRDVVERPPALLFVDIDDFKVVNDGCGHDAGDRLLMDAASRLRGCARPEDLVARVGGDTFALLIEERPASPSAAVDIAERVLKAFQRPFDVSGHKHFIGASIGISSYDVSAPDADQVLRRADIALYSAKSTGKFRYAVFSDQMDDVFRVGSSVVTGVRE
jgi:diguanylate cyclase (GGDEF)-like protein/PAS domain S-box-containing protein